jgi:hypothetical protein
MQQAQIFGLDAGSRVLMTRAVEFSSAKDLRKQLQLELDQYSSIEAWVESVCVLRLYADDPEG